MAYRTTGRAGALALALLAAGCLPQGDPLYQGWAEADTVFVAPDEAGRVETLSVREGDTVSAGQQLFTVDEDLQRADLRQAEAALTNARQAFERAQTLLKTNTGSQMTFDNAQAALRQAEASLSAAQTRLNRRKVSSAVTGAVQRVYFRPGEMVPAGRPAVAILPPANIKLRFYVPETALAGISRGQTVAIQCDGCPQGETARVSFISDSAEYTPPVIYSLQERTKLVFLIEARPEHPERLRPGQPVSVATAPVREAKQ